MLSEGRSASISFTVDAGSTAAALGSGDVDVLGTPKVVALVEQAAVAAVAGSLPAGQTTVGTNITLDHLRPSRVGVTVVANAVLTSVDGKRLSFAVKLVEGEDLAARGTHTRFVVDRKAFEGS